MSGGEILEQRKNRLKALLRKSSYYPYLVLSFLVVLGYFIRTRNLKHLIDSTTGKYIPVALDPFVFLRYAKEILANGSLSAVDAMRYFPFGYGHMGEFGLLSNVIVWIYKFLHIFNSEVTLEYAHVVYPPILFCLSLIFFYLLVKRLFDTRVAMLASAFLVVLPSYLYRTMAGFADKESLAMFFMFAAMYFYVRAWQESNLKSSLFFGLISGIVSGLMGLTWGGVNFLFLIFGSFALIEVVLNKFTEKDFYVYSVWLFSMMLILKVFFGARYTLSNLALSVTSGFMFLAFLVGLINLLINKKNLFGLKDKLKDKLPVGIFSLVSSVVIGLLSIIVLEGFGAISGKVGSFVRNLLEPFGFTRWNLTVAESHQPYVIDWINSWGWIYLFMMLLGSILLVYNLLRKTKIRKVGMSFYALFIVSFIFSRYKVGTKLDGVSGLSKTLYIGSLIALFVAVLWLYFYAYKKDRELYGSILRFDKNILFMLMWFLILTVAARGAIRLLHVYSPVTTIFVAYAFVKLYDYAKNLDKKYFRYAALGILLLMLVLPVAKGGLVNMYASSKYQAEFTGPSYNIQWQEAMKWVREETPKDAVFAHWWDYGYWVQTGGERATLTDGGNAGGYALNYFMGRHVITGQSEIEALEYLYARNATHLLMIVDEIGKYPAFSSIGSDVNYDRYGWISTFQVDHSRTQEKRENVELFFAGSHVFDEDFVFADKVFPKGSSGIGGVVVPVVTHPDGKLTISQPSAIVVYAGQQFSVPLECVFVEGKEVEFDLDGLEGCLVLIPRFTGNQFEPVGAGLYVSSKIRRTVFTHLFLYGEKSGNFRVVYDDSGKDVNTAPLMVYNGRLVGPLKIWEINYPSGLKPSDWYYGNELPDPNVMAA
tara:strand:- start:6712 stop:9342 length:2631 start_codon:yes stop_codon:yes gene_type:complete